MALILNIYTATETASVGLMEGEKELSVEINKEQRDHSSWLQNAIQRILTASGRSVSDLNAIAVAEGPGSYTGLRVGMATAKGLCFALNIPLITESTLKIMALASLENWHKNNSINKQQIILFCPMIDARRLEVFSAVYEEELGIVEKAAARILDESSYNDLLLEHKVVFSGSGSNKFERLISNQNADFQTVNVTATQLGTLSYQKYLQSEFADLAYAEPAYLKEVYLAGS
ncbi:tRNA (adenosine(37)-N6)-threonylcarbamoyltransferase complex dimerization subunit type 1 TsaB [Chitinophagaceae bacterium 26-R-25]|nr:tRNA (adenosine(37)-N6)-threonylcarbamoyltransferase complex dimerization subunit type 1 TsaB [Chitinophagaceae bacterium 26-R-25]